jgi:FlaA1/EpsC-like NDP-sugar epimerase
MSTKYGGEKASEIDEIGLQPGENMHETMDGKVFSNEVEHYTQEEILRLI